MPITIILSQINHRIQQWTGALILAYSAPHFTYREEDLVKQLQHWETAYSGNMKTDILEVQRGWHW